LAAKFKTVWCAAILGTLFVLGVPCSAAVSHTDDVAAPALRSKAKLPLLTSSVHQAVKTRRVSPDALQAKCSFGFHFVIGDHLPAGQMPLTVARRTDTRTGRSPPQL
jgi:hypothetical protein